jgi:hypothetical protein
MDFIKRRTLELELEGHGSRMPRRLPAPWRVERIPGGYIVCDANDQNPAGQTRPRPYRPRC